MFISNYNSHTKEYLIYKNNEQCAILTRHNLILNQNLIFTVDEICQMLDCCEVAD